MTHDRDGPTSNHNKFAMDLAKSSAAALCTAEWLRWNSVVDEIDDDDQDFLQAQPEDGSTVTVETRPGAVSGSPVAESLSEPEIAREFAKGQDPWARCINEDLPSQSGLPRPSAIIATVGLSALIKDKDVLNDIFRPGGITNVICASPAMRCTFEEVIRMVSDHWKTQVSIERSVDLHCQVFGTRRTAPAKDRTRSLHEYQAKIESNLRNHAAIMVVSSHAQQLPRSLQSLTRKTLRWPGLTADMILATLRLTHSTTGLVADREIQNRLPSQTALRRLEPSQIDAAFEEPTTLLVADRFAEIASAALAPSAVTLDAVHGLGDVRHHLDRMLDDLTNWQQGRLAWSDVASSVVFHGPPGTGKTMLAKAIAGSAGIPLISTSYADCQKAGHQGDMLAALATAFDEAAQAAPAVLFIDEIDSFSSRATDGQSRSYMRGVVNGLLEQINHAAEIEGLILLGATNHLDAIDPAVIRSGRFDLKLHIPYPDTKGIKAILAASLGRNRTEQLDLRSISDRLIGQSGAAVEALARDALGRSRAEKSSLQQKHLTEAADHLAPAISLSLLRRVAIHEAGHILAVLLLPLPTPKRAQLTAHGGMVVQRHLPILTPELARAQLQVLLAGRAAEIHFYGTPTSGAGIGPESDLAQATNLALAAELRWGFGESGLAWHGASNSSMHTVSPDVKQRVEEHLKEAHESAAVLIQGNTNLLSKIADRLVDVREIDEQELDAIRRSLPDRTEPPHIQCEEAAF